MVVQFANIDMDERPILILKRADETPIGVLGYATNVEFDPKYNELSIDNYLYAATSYLMAKNYAAAEKYSRLYLVMFEHNTDAVSVLSESLACQGDGVAALRVLNTMPYKDASFYRSRGIIYLQSETYQFAIDDFNRAIDLDPTLYDIYLHRGMAYYYLGKKDDAKRDWNTAVKDRVYKANDYLEKYR